MLAPTLLGSQRQIRVQQIHIEARPVGLLDGVVGWIHGADIVAKTRRTAKRFLTIPPPPAAARP